MRQGDRQWVGAVGVSAAGYFCSPEIHGETDDEEYRRHQQEKEPNDFVRRHAAKLTGRSLKPDEHL